MEASVVQKYGGTSVGTPDRIGAIAERIAAQFNGGLTRIAVVVSAMSGETNRLVALVGSVNPNAGAKSYDMVVAAGEQVSVGLMCAALEKQGLRAEPLLAYQLNILTDDFHRNARIRAIDTQRIELCWSRGEVPVVAGFQGITHDRSITTLGRGGSDTSAVALAVALGADECEINTDVDGVFTADPRIVKDAQLIETLDYEVALELSALGSKVLHSRCVELGAKFKLPLTVRNSFAPNDGRKTRLITSTEKQALESPVVSGVTLDKNVAKLTLRGINAVQDADFVPELFSQIAARGINVDIIVQDRLTEQTNLGFTVSAAERQSTEEVVKTLLSRRQMAHVELNSVGDLCKVSAVGLGMRSHPGVASRVFVELARHQIPVLMISTSEIKISCVVDEKSGEQATQILHAAFF